MKSILRREFIKKSTSAAGSLMLTPPLMTNLFNPIGSTKK